jgi:pyrroloquinoline quinone (PQQ) biosynthesis protein C
MTKFKIETMTVEEVAALSADERVELWNEMAIADNTDNKPIDSDGFSSTTRLMIDMYHKHSSIKEAILAKYTKQYLQNI